MTYLTIFTSPKPFTLNPHINTIQRNAIQSWLHLSSEVDVFMMGDEAGMADVALEFRVRQFSDVRLNEMNTPLLNSMFQIAREASQSPYLMFTNADILYLPDILDATRQVAAQTRDFLLLGRRWDLDITESLDFSSGWDERLRSDTIRRGQLHAPVGSDYFIYPRHLMTDMPDFAIGRSGWDNWTIYHGRQAGWAVVDITRAAMVIHQNHDYSHLPGGLPPYDLEETQRNIRLAGGMKNMYTILETNKILEAGKLRPALITVPKLSHWLELKLIDSDPRSTPNSLVRRLRRTRRKYITTS